MEKPLQGQALARPACQAERHACRRPGQVFCASVPGYVRDRRGQHEPALARSHPRDRSSPVWGRGRSSSASTGGNEHRAVAELRRLFGVGKHMGLLFPGQPHSPGGDLSATRSYTIEPSVGASERARPMYRYTSSFPASTASRQAASSTMLSAGLLHSVGPRSASLPTVAGDQLSFKMVHKSLAGATVSLSDTTAGTSVSASQMGVGYLGRIRRHTERPLIARPGVHPHNLRRRYVQSLDAVRLQPDEVRVVRRICPTGGYLLAFRAAGPSKRPCPHVIGANSPLLDRLERGSTLATLFSMRHNVRPLLGAKP